MQATMNKLNKPAFPAKYRRIGCVGSSRNLGMVVLFTNYKTGMVIETPPCAHYYVGFYTKDWICATDTNTWERVEEPKQDDTPAYPALYANNSNDYVVLATSEVTGVVVQTNGTISLGFACVVWHPPFTDNTVWHKLPTTDSITLNN